MLTREQCEKLKEWGMDQNTKGGVWYYNQDGLPRLVPVFGDTERFDVKIPNLQDLLEFARREYVWVDLTARPFGGWWAIIGLHCASENIDPCEAVYAAIEQAKEKEVE